MGEALSLATRCGLEDLCHGLDMTRQAVAKHLAILKKANLLSWKREGRERLHFINPVPNAQPGIIGVGLFAVRQAEFFCGRR